MAIPVTLFDSMTREVRDIVPLDGRCYRFYCCGPTVYGPSHIGNFRTFVVQDTFRRVLESAGLSTKHVRNVTDVDDKTIRDSMAAGKSLREFTDQWKERFHADCRALNLREPHVEPGAVDHIAHQIRMIERLMAKGHAYQKDDGSVYFRVESYADYGRLSRVAERELKMGAAQAANDADEYEKDSLADFALWKGRKPEDGDNFWPSPWGEGRPGWHLECSAMSLEYLGETLDMHSGGVDLMFPHHENEIAQSECCIGRMFARHWFHITHLLVDGGKMSKSLGNFYTLADLEEKGHTAAELRYVYLSGHYRHPLNFTLDSLRAARQAMGRLAKFARALSGRAGNAETSRRSAEEVWGLDGPFRPAFEALCRDMNTPDALGKVFSAIRELDVASLSRGEAVSAWESFRAVIETLGLVLPLGEGEGGGEQAAEVPEEICRLAEERWEARQSKDWAASDSLRDRLADQGWVVQDGKEGYTLTPRTNGS